jgi:DNA-binding MarR family transcriptional regulator
MHAALFGLKRLYLSVVEWAKWKVGRWCEDGITPARYDLLRIVRLYQRVGGLPQWKIVRLLGVSATVVSRMLRALEGTGIVRRERWERDRRVLWVSLTDEGVAVVNEVDLSLLETGVVDRTVRAAFAEERQTPMNDVERVETYLTRARIYFRDRAPVRHPWRIVDLVDMWGRTCTLEPFRGDDEPVPASMGWEDSTDDLSDLDPEELAMGYGPNAWTA